MAKQFSKKFYSSKAWQKCRDAYAKKAGHLCENCLRKGIYTPGVIVHHVEELTPQNIQNPEIATSFDNLELLCRKCHEEEHGFEFKGRWSIYNAKQREKFLQSRRYLVDANGKISPNIPPGGSENG